jgi:ribosomal protein S18 acetylase RimI-like enzyme
MTPVSLVREVEAVAYRCWPAAEMEIYDGWQLRYANGFSRRGNSVYPAESSTLDHETKLEWCREWYKKRNLGLVVRQTPASESGLDDILDARGFAAEGRTRVMVADLEPARTGTADIAEQPDALWWRTMADLWGIGADRAEAWRGIVDRISQPSGFGLVIRNRIPVAAGLAVVDGEWLGLFEIIVAGGLRRQGVGQGLTRLLMEWGSERGARCAFLQVVATNTPALSMYESLGFATAYSYWYRREPTTT